MPVTNIYIFYSFSFCCFQLFRYGRHVLIVWNELTWGFFSVVFLFRHLFFKIVSFSWQMCQRRFAHFSICNSLTLMRTTDTRYGSIKWANDWSAVDIAYNYSVLFDPRPKRLLLSNNNSGRQSQRMCVRKRAREGKRIRATISFIYCFFWPIKIHHF